MTRLNFSVAERFGEANLYLQELLDNLGRERQVEFQLHVISWANLWPALKSVALGKGELDISEVGTTWVESFVGMAALRPFAPAEIARMGGAEAFIPASWESAQVAGDPRIWAVPWLADTRIIFYWRDMLEAAGIDEATAFETLQRMDETFARLQASGVAAPWVAPTIRANNTTHHIASWVWGQGGDFVSPDGKVTRFGQPQALAGIAAYFQLYRYLPDNLPLLDMDQMADLFARRQAAAMMDGPWFLARLYNEGAPHDLLARLGAALPPGPPFVGGSNLVIWQHVGVRDERIALDLIHRLLSPRIQMDYCRRAGLLPVRLDVLSEPPYTTDAHLWVFGEALKLGRPFASLPLWGVIEDRLTDTFGEIWSDIIANPHHRVDDVVASHLEPLARRVDRMLGQD